MRTCALTLLSLFAVSAVAQTTTVVEHVRLIDGTGAPARPNMTVIFTGDTIQVVEPDRQRRKVADVHMIDAKGETMMPGILNAHGHLALVDGTKNSDTFYTLPHVLAELRQYEHYGVTGMLSLGLNRDLVYLVRAQQQAGSLDGATVFVADRGIGVPEGAPPISHAGDQLYQPATPEEARKAVDEAAARHTNFIKVWVDSLYGTKAKMKPEIYTAVIDEAHKNHIPVAAHVYALADAKSLVQAGVDVIAHSVRDQPVDREFIALMKQHNTFYLPTLTVDESFFVFADHPELLDDPFLVRATSPEELALLKSDAYRKKVAADPQTAQHRTDFAMAKKNLKTLYASGVNIGFGTDSGAMPTRIPGYAEHRELQLMVEAGLTPLQAIRCATRTNATLLGISAQNGTIAPGHKADFLLLAEDPSHEISNTRRMVSIWHNGFEGEPWVKDTGAPAPVVAR